ncbi:MAG: DevR family CRISPR-associated autoregulator [Xenococcaceae cyanobacterium MO_188.B32]|nr:DevR family CRISPR-associated autoregulator [Xenococcaceae cyanobacterium MO_188.B32]
MTKNNKFTAYSISISGILSWQLHALNNEGNEGNQTLTRRYYIVEKNDPEPKYVNGVSGDMLKHIQAEHLHRIAIDENLNLSEGGRRFDPDRIGYDIEHPVENAPLFAENETELDARTARVIQTCTISDLEGFMVTVRGGQTLKRESVIEFGAVVGIPTFVKTQSYFHAKYGRENPTPYNTQVSSGLYATVLNLEAFRIGYNPHSFNYAIERDERKKRLDALLKSVLYTYMQPNGAKRNTNLPHPDYFEGVITVSTRRCPAPMISPLAIGENSYIDQINSLKKTLNGLKGSDTIHNFEFETMAQFAERIKEITEKAQPWESDNAEAIE